MEGMLVLVGGIFIGIALAVLLGPLVLLAYGVVLVGLGFVLVGA